MVFKPFTHLARQSFAKTFTHGYAQSVVAASQSSYASQTTSFNSLGNSTSRFSKSGTSQFQNALQNNSGVKSAHLHHNGIDGGLAAYFAAWQQRDIDAEQEWKQFQFTKRIGWKAPTSSTEKKGKSKDDVSNKAEESSWSPSEKVQSTSMLPRAHKRRL